MFDAGRPGHMHVIDYKFATSEAGDVAKTYYTKKQ